GAGRTPYRSSWRPDAVLGGGEVGDAAFDGTGRAAEDEVAVDHRQSGRHLERHGIGRALELVGGELGVDVGFGGHGVGLVIDDDEAVRGFNEELDVALDHPVADGGAHVYLPVADGLHRQLDRLRGQGGAGHGGDEVGVLGDRLQVRLVGRLRLEADQCGQIDELQRGVDGPADGGAGPAPPPRRHWEVCGAG